MSLLIHSAFCQVHKEKLNTNFAIERIENLGNLVDIVANMIVNHMIYDLKQQSRVTHTSKF